jgi:protein-disulfide isomerase
VVATPEGGFRMGNPAAKVKVVEYGSLTCPHCAEFAGASKGPLTAHVRSGKVSFEFRNYVLNAPDVAASLLARCGGAGRFFPLVERFYAQQPQWLAKVHGLTDAQNAEIEKLPLERMMPRLAAVAGLVPISAGAGLTPQQARACLASRPAIDRLVRLAEAAGAQGVDSTPTFFVNGARVHAHEWAELEPIIRRAGG